MRNLLGSVIKYLVFGFNAITCIAGLACVGFSIFGLLSDDVTLQFVPNKYGFSIEPVETGDSDVESNNTAEIVILCVGGAVALASLVGIFGALKENKLFLFIYFVFVLLCTIGSSTSTTLFRVRNGDNSVQTAMFGSLSLYNDNSTQTINKEITAAWDAVQSENSCCGVNSYQDWTLYPTIFDYDGLSPIVPDSCCTGLPELDFLDCTRRPFRQEYKARMRGCASTFEKTFHGRTTALEIVSGSFTGILFLNLVVVFAFGLMIQSKHGSKDSYQPLD